MGGCFTKCYRGQSHEALSAHEPKSENAGKTAYSWDQRQTIDRSNFIVDAKSSGQTVIRRPDSINGQQFVIQDCKNSLIFVLDHMAQVSVDDCQDCTIIMGPVTGSVFVRDCENLKIAVACQQFRVRDCREIQVFLSCVAQPIIESSSKIKFGCYELNYLHLEDQFKKAGVSIFNCNWSNVHDFCKDSGETHYALINTDSEIKSLIMGQDNEEVQSLGLQMGTQHSLVPVTRGQHRVPNEEETLVVFFNNEDAQQKALQFIKAIQDTYLLIQTRETKLSDEEAQRVFDAENHLSAAKLGQLIAVHICGLGCVEGCQSVLAKINENWNGVSFACTDSKTSSMKIANFFNVSNMQMGL